MTALIAEDLYRFYHAGDDERLALRGVSLELEAGELVAVTGPSGSGKSTLLACLAGLDEPDGGAVRVAGQRLSRRSESQRARLRAAHIGLVFQSFNLVGHLTIADNVRLLRRRFDETLLGECGIAGRAQALPRELSGGELARAALAVALAAEPTVLLADEPTGELDEASTERVLTLLKRRSAEGTAVLVVTHDPWVAAFADRKIRLRDGRVQT